MLANPLPPSFLDTYSLSTSSLWSNALCMVITFLVLWSIIIIIISCCSSSSSGPLERFFLFIYTWWSFLWNLTDHNSPQVSRILVNLNNALVWVVSARPPISNSSSSLIKLLSTVPSAPNHKKHRCILMFLIIICSLVRSKYLSLFFAFFVFPSIVYWNGKIHYTADSLFLSIIIITGLLARIRSSI